MPANLKNSAVVWDGKISVFILIPKKRNAKECSNYHKIALISHASKVMLEMLQARLKQYMNQELPDVQDGCRICRGTRNQIANIWGIIEKAREFQRNIYFCLIDYTKASDCVDHNKLWNILKEMGLPGHFICLLRNMYADKQQLELVMEQLTISKLGKVYIKIVYCHSAYLTYMEITSCEMLGQMTLKLKSRLLGEISITSDM